MGFRVATGLDLGWPQNERSSLETLSWSRSSEKNLALEAVVRGDRVERVEPVVRVQERSMWGVRVYG